MSQTATIEKPARKATGFKAVFEERLVAVNNGFGAWENFLFGEFDEVGQRCLDMAAHLSLDDALQRAGMGYDVRQFPLQVEVPGTGYLTVPEKSASVRMDTLQVVGVNGAGYQMVPYKNAFAIAEALDLAAAESGEQGGFIGMAELDGGCRAAAIYALPRLDIGRDEEVLPIVLIWSSHDGTKAIEVQFVPVRVACFNGNLWHVEGTSSIWRAKHTVTIETKMAAAHEALSQGNDFLTAYAVEARTLIAARLSKTKVDEVLGQLFAPAEGTGQKAATIAERNIAAVKAIYLHAPDLQNIQGRKWGVLQAVAAWVDHEQRTRLVDDGREVEVQMDELRFVRATSQNDVKDRARALLLAA